VQHQFGPVVIAHRGFSAAAPEHTFAAWDMALEAGADYLEQDLQMTADGVLVVLHDDTLDRTARGEGCTGPVRERTIEQLDGCEVGSWFNERWPDHARAEFVGQRIPTFRDVLERYAGRARFYVETKNPTEAPGMEQELVALLREFGLLGVAAPGPPAVIVQSFSPESLLTLGQIAPGLPRVQLLSDEYDAVRTLELLPRIAFFAQGIGPWHGSVTPELVAAASERGLLVHPYTVNETARMAELLEAGVDGMFTDRPDALRALIDGQRR
jgi:glycerophosphoryl diester phosphodiesterase